MSNSSHAKNAQNGPQERSAGPVRIGGLDKPEIVVSAIVARPAGILAEIWADPERSAALSLARAYMDDYNYKHTGESVLRVYYRQQARHYYRIALGLEVMDSTTGEA